MLIREPRLSSSSYIARIDRSRLFCCRAEIFARKGSLARGGGGCNELSLAPPLSTAGYDNNNPNCVINSIWKQDTNEVYYMAPSASARRLLAIQRNQTTECMQLVFSQCVDVVANYVVAQEHCSARFTYPLSHF